MPDANERVAAALAELAEGIPDGDHHHRWIFDQILRHLTGCPMVRHEGTDYRGNPITYEALGESEEYTAWVAAFEGDEGEYEWDIGIPP